MDIRAYIIYVAIFINMILLKSLHEQSFWDRFKRTKPETETLTITPTTWTHATNSEELVQRILSGQPYVGRKEDLNQFNRPNRGSFATYVNQHAPNFKRGGVFSGYEISDYIITTELPETAFQPNWNATNYDSFDASQQVGVLRPQYRAASNFKVWRRTASGPYELMRTNMKT